VTANGGTFATITGTAANVSQSVNAIFEPAERILGF
jgi:hypothetical protein